MDWFGAVTLLIGRGGRRLSFWRAAPFAALLTLVGVTLLCAILFDVSAAHAVEAVNVRTDVTAIDLTGVADVIHTDTDTIAVSAAPGADGIVRRMQQPAKEGSTNWAVFALAAFTAHGLTRLRRVTAS